MDQNKIPSHLRKYVVDQNYSRYTAEDQAVWRYIMRQLKNYLSVHAHECYVDGLSKTGLSVEKIPHIEDMNLKLNEFGWSAIPVSGFIPPAAFMEFQSLSILPIASDMRSIDHIEYTPAPDIVHEAAGHAPILIDQKFSDYLKRYAAVASKAIISFEDLKLYEAIRELSDAKENPSSSPEEIARLEKHLEDTTEAMTFVSEASLLGRMNWWTAEYGLIGDIKNPKIFGAGLLSSIGEARSCLKDDVAKIALDIDCIDYGYDITEPQPQLFVTETFENLITVLDKLADQMAFKRGGIFGLDRAIEANTVNTVVSSCGVEISGKLVEYKTYQKDDVDYVSFIKMAGPTQLSLSRKEIKGHGKDYHLHGYSTPIGKIVGFSKCLSDMSIKELADKNIDLNKVISLQYESGIKFIGTLKGLTSQNGKNLIFKFSDTTITNGDEILYQPDWGLFDLVPCLNIPSVYGGPADTEAYGETTEFAKKLVPTREFSTAQENLYTMYQQVRVLREANVFNPETFNALKEKFLSEFNSHWLIGLELLELMHTQKFSPDDIEQFSQTLVAFDYSKYGKSCLQAGIDLAKKPI